MFSKSQLLSELNSPQGSQNDADYTQKSIDDNIISQNLKFIFFFESVTNP
jgi:hypothetical protein